MNPTLPVLPVEISDVSLAFPADALDYMPAWKDIPDDFKRRTEASAQWHELASTWFGQGLNAEYTGFLSVEVDGEHLSGEMITRQISAILGSYAPKHEHKMAAVAYLLSLWLDSVVYGPAGCEKDDLTVIGDFILDEWVEHVEAGRPTIG